MEVHDLQKGRLCCSQRSQAWWKGTARSDVSEDPPAAAVEGEQQLPPITRCLRSSASQGACEHGMPAAARPRSLRRTRPGVGYPTDETRSGASLTV